MKKAERLFQLLTFLQGRRQAITAQTIADHMEVSKRTIYRDIQALIRSGIPIVGEAGFGYQLDRRFLMPPIMFKDEELTAIRLGMAFIKNIGDSELNQAATSVLEKVEAQLDDKYKKMFNESGLIIADSNLDQKQLEFLTQLRAAISLKLIIEVHYEDLQNQKSFRTLEPLGLLCYGKHWTLVAWCCLRGDYRAFRVERFLEITQTNSTFTTNNKKSIQHYMATLTHQYDAKWHF